MKIKPSTTVAELMLLLKDSKEFLSHELDDPIPSFNLYSDGSFEIVETFYETSATLGSSIIEDNNNNTFTGKSISNIMINRLNEKDSKCQQKPKE